MSAEASIVVDIGQLRVDVSLTVADGEVVALLGPNGAGKTTVLRALAGLQPLTEGSITIGGRTVDDPSRGVFVAPEQRRVGMAFQDYALFSSMSVLENVAFGQRARGAGRVAARQAANEWLQRVGLGDHATARPTALSGGQAQRVALARALAISPDLLLLDEPLAALDATTRGSVRSDLARHLRETGVATVVVTHDPVDAAALADRIVVMEHGQVLQQGALSDIAAHPRSRYVADLVGVNLVRGTVHGGVLTSEHGAQVVIADAPEGRAWAMIRPHSVVLARQVPDTSVRNTWAATVSGVEQLGNRVRVQLDGTVPLTAEVTAAGLEALGATVGSQVYASVKATDIEVYPEVPPT